MAKIYNQRNAFNNYIIDTLSDLKDFGTDVVASVSKSIQDFAEFNMHAQQSAGLTPDPEKPSKIESEPKPEPVYTRPDNFEEEMEEGQWYEAIVDNTNVQSGTRLNDYGYLTVHCDDAQDGEYILVNSEGTVQLIEQMELSEDKRKEVDEFKAEHNSARTQYERNLEELQKAAKKGSTRIEIDITDAHQTNTFLDILVNSFNEYAKLNEASYQITKDPTATVDRDTSKLVQSWKDYGMSTMTGRIIMNNLIKIKYGEDWKEQFSGSAEATKAFINLDEVDELKEYMAYQIVTGSDGISLGHAGTRVLAEIAEAGDAFAAPIKAIFAPHWNELWGGDEVDEPYIDRLASGFAPTYSETGRHVYEYNSGMWWADLALEVLSDPSTLLSLGAKGFAKAGASSLDEVIKDIAKQSADDVTSTLSKRALKQTVWKSVKEGVSNKELASNIASRISTTPTEDMINTLEQALDYSHAINMSRSLKGIDAFKDSIEYLLVMPTVGPSRTFVRGIIKGKNKLTDLSTAKAMEIEKLTAKAMVDAHIEVTKNANVPITISTVEAYMNALDKNILGINIGRKEKLLNNLSKEARIKTVADANINACNDIDNAIAELTQDKSVRTADIPAKLGMVVQMLTDGKCYTVEEYIDEVLRILRENDVYDYSIVARLETTRRLYNRAVTEQVDTTLIEMYKNIQGLKTQYFETLKVLQDAKPKFVPYEKFKDVIDQLAIKAGKPELTSFKVFFKRPEVQTQLKSFVKYKDALEAQGGEALTSFKKYFKESGTADRRLSFIKFKDELKKEYGEKYLSFKNYYHTPEVQARIIKYKKYNDEVSDKLLIVKTIEEFFEDLKNAPDYEPLYQREIEELYQDYCMSLERTNKEIREHVHREVVDYNRQAHKNNQLVYEESLAEFKKVREEVFQKVTSNNDFIKDYNDLIYNEALEEFNSARAEIIDSVKVDNESVKAWNDVVFKQALAYYSDARAQLYTMYQATKDMVHNLKVSDYEFQLASALKSECIRVVYSSKIFPSDFAVQQELSILQQMLDKPTLSSKEWYTFFDKLDNVIKLSQEYEYTRLGTGTAELPYTEVLINVDQIKSDLPDYAKVLKDSGVTRTVEDFGSMSQVQGKLYDVKLNKIVEANTIIKKPEVSRAYSSIVEGGEFGQAVLELLNTKSPKAYLHRAAAELVNDAYSAQRYTRIMYKISGSERIPDTLKGTLTDKLFAMDSQIKNVFKQYKQADRLLNTITYQGLTKELIDSTARRKAIEWVNQSLKHIADSNDVWYNPYLNKACNTPDTLANVRNIEKEFNKVCTNIMSDREEYVFYSVSFHGDSGAIKEFSMRTANGYEFTIKGKPYGTSIEKQYVLHQISKAIEVLRTGDVITQGAGSRGKNLKFVGFNNHVTGYDLDHKFNLHTYHTGTSPIILGGTIDVAEQIHISKGLPVIPEAAYREVEEILSDEFLKWISDVYQTSCDLSLSVTPTITSSSKFTKYLEYLVNYKNPTDHGLIRRFKEISDSLRAAQKSVTRANRMLSSSGMLYTEHYSNIMPLLKEFPNEIIELKLRYDDRVISRYFNKELADGDKASTLFEFGQACDKVLSNIYSYDVLNAYASYIDMVFVSLTMPDGSVSEWLTKRGIVFKDPSTLTIPEKYAIIHNVYKAIGLKDLKPIMDLDPDAAKLIYNPQRFLYSKGRETNVYEALPGSVVRESSMLNTSNTILNHVENISQQLNKFIDSVEAQERALRTAGITGSLEYAQVKTKAKLSRKLTRFVTNVQNAITSMNETNLEAFNLLYDNSPMYATERLKSARSELGIFNKAVHDGSKYHDDLKLAYIASQSSEDLVSHLIKDCNGRLFFHKDTSNLGLVNEIIDKLKHDPHVKHDETDELIRIWYSKSTLVDSDIDTIIQNLSTFSLPQLRHADENLLRTKFGEDPGPIEIYFINLFEMIDELAEYGPNNLTYGMFTMNTPDLLHRMDSVFFEGIQDDLLDIGVLNALGNFKGQALCSYHGDISVLSREGLFLSNNQFVNICNMYGHIINTVDSRQYMLNLIFDECNNFSNAVELLHSLDGISGHKAVVDTLDAQGYVAVAITGDKDGLLKLHKLNIADHNVYKRALKNRYTTIMRYDTFRELQNQLELKNLATSSSKTTYELWERVQEALAFYNHNVRAPFIQTMLFMKPSTWLRNIPDSVAKALLKEGTEYLQYIPEAMRVLNAYKTIEDKIYDLYHKVDPLTISRYFNEHPDSPMTRDMFTMLKSYWNNPISGTQAENILKAFNLDPTSIFARYTDLGLSDKDYKYVIEVFKKYDNVDVPIYKRMSQINEELRIRYTPAQASKLTNVYETSYSKLSKYEKGGTILDEIPVLNKWLNFNAERFNDVETINRLAIFLKRIEAGDNMGQALEAIGETQFDYSKTDFMKATELIAPFSTFKLYNYQFWLDTVWNYGVIEYLGDAAQLFLPDNSSDDYWSDENMSYRAMMCSFLDTLPAEERNKDYEYDSFRDYKGVKGLDALAYGWLRIGDELYLKVGASFMDPINLMYAIGNPSEFSEYAQDMVFAPVNNIATLCKDFYEMDDVSKSAMIDSMAKVIAQINMSDYAKQSALESVAKLDTYNPYDMQDIVLSEYVLDHAYELTNLIPVLGSIYYSMYSTARNINKAVKDGNITQEELFTFIPSLFAPAKDETYNKYAESYYAKPVGFDWYNQTEEYRKTHRYVVGVSYVPAHVNKDPATYIDTWGRMQQLGIPKEALPELFENGKSWWFTKDDYGTYKLHNYQLIIKDETAYTEIYNTLLKYGWTKEEAEQLMAEVAISPWNYDKSYDNLSGIPGYGKYSNLNVSSVLNATLNNSKATLNRAKYDMAKYSGSGKWSQYDTLPKTYRQYRLYGKGHDTTRLSKRYQTAYRWHRRNRDIYRDNYAKYGASRMAMEQNLRAYSNRSITEMRRTNQNIRYARIHNRWWAT